VELTTLRYFREIARIGHLTRAAQSLGVTQPALSAMLKKLEAEAGAPLLHRTGRGVELTEAGRVFLTHADEAIRRAEAGLTAVRELAGLERGSIRIGGGATATAYLLPPVISAVRAKHPGIRFYIREAGSSAVAAAVLSGELDLGIVTVPHKGRWTLPGSDDLLVTSLVEDELRLIVPGAHALSRIGVGSRAKGEIPAKAAVSDSIAGSFRWKDIHADPHIAFEAGTAVRTLIDRAAAAAGVHLDVVMELRSIESIKRMVAEGIGVGFVSRFALRDHEGLACREGRLSRQLAIVRRADRASSAAAKAFERAMLQRYSPSTRA